MMHVLVIAVLLVGRVLFVLRWPTGRCSRCHGKRVIFRAGRKPAKCPRCKGTGRRRRIGARLIHAVFWAILADFIRDRIAAKYDKEGDQR